MEWYIEIDSNFNDIDLAEAELSAFLLKAQAEINQRLIFILTLALRELLLNAVEHGNKMTDGKKVRCRFTYYDQKAAMFDIYDEGTGFLYRPVTDEVGRERQRGIAILEKMGFIVDVENNHVQARLKIEK